MINNKNIDVRMKSSNKDTALFEKLFFFYNCCFFVGFVGVAAAFVVVAFEMNTFSSCDNL